MNLLFDLDGTLTDPYQGITNCISHALISLDRPSPPPLNLQWCIGPPLKSSFAKLLDSKDDRLLEKALSIYRKRFGSIGIFENEIYEGIPEILNALRNIRHVLYVATSKPTVYARRIIDYFGLNSFFKYIYGSELDGARTDKTDLISYILQRESLSPSETVMIGDREHDMIGAKNNGIRGYGVLWGYGSREELEASGAHVCFSHAGELIVEFNEKVD